MWTPRRGWFPVFVDCLLAFVAAGFVLFLASVVAGCTVVNVAAGSGASVEKDSAGVLIRPKRKE